MSIDFENQVPALGTKGRPFSVEIEAGKVAEFARAIGADPEAGVPLTFLESARFWRPIDSNPWLPDPETLARTLHAAQEYEFSSLPLRPGEGLTGQARVDKVYEKIGKRAGRLMFVEIVTDYTNQTGTMVASVRQTTATTERAPERDLDD